MPTYPSTIDAFLEWTFESPTHLKKAFRKLALRAHPDKGGTKQQFVRLNDAMESGLAWMTRNPGKPYSPEHRHYLDDMMRRWYWNQPAAPKKPPQATWYRGKAFKETPWCLRPGFAADWAKTAGDMQSMKTGKPHSKGVSKWLDEGSGVLERLSRIYTAWHTTGIPNKISSAEWLKWCEDPLKSFLFSATSDEGYTLVDLKLRESCMLPEFSNLQKVDYGDIDAARKARDDDAEFLRGIRAEIADLWGDVLSRGESKHVSQLHDKLTQARAAHVDQKRAHKEVLKALKDRHEEEVDELDRQRFRSAQRIKDLRQQLQAVTGRPVPPPPLGSVDVDSALAGDFFANTTPAAIKQARELITTIYAFFGHVGVDPEGRFSVGDALAIARQLEPDADRTDKVERAFVNLKMKAFRRLAKKRSWDVARVSGRPYVLYGVLFDFLMTVKDLPTLRKMMCSLASRVIAPCGATLVAGMLHLRDIASGEVDHNIACSVLGLSSEKQRRKYLTSVKSFSDSNSSCVHSIAGKKVCGKRVLNGKDECSYHARKKLK